MKKTFLAILSTTFLTSITGLNATTTLKDRLGVFDDTITSVTQHPTFASFAKKYPRAAEGSTSVDFDTLSKIRTKYENLSYGDQIRAMRSADPLFLEEARKLVDFMKSEPHAEMPAVKKMINKIESRIEKNLVTPRWLMTLPLEYVAATSDISEEELDFYRHIFDHDQSKHIKSREDFLTASKFLVPGKTRFLKIVLSSLLHQNPPYGKVYSKDTDRIVIDMDKSLVGTLGYTIPGISKFSITFMNALMSDQIMPISIPSKKKQDIQPHAAPSQLDGGSEPAQNTLSIEQISGDEPRAADVQAHVQNQPQVQEPAQPKLKAHGLETDAEGFTVHDYSHQRLIQDNEEHAFRSYILSAATKAFEKGEAVEPFIKRLTPNALDRHNGIYHLQQVIMIRLIDRALTTKDFKSLRQAMLGQFVMQHEYPGLGYKAYEMDSAKDVIQYMADKTNSIVSSSSLWLSPYDPLMTSPIDGSSPLSDADIVDKFLKKLKKGYYHDTLPYNVFCDAGKPILPSEDIDRSEVKRTQRHIDVTIKLKNGSEIHQSFDTYYHKWTNLDDTLSLLGYAGIKLSKPSLEGTSEQDAHRICFNLLSQTHQQIMAQVSHYATVATDILREPFQAKDGSKNLGQAYKKWSQSLRLQAEK